MLNLMHGRTLSVEAAGADELVEIRESSGQVALRVKLTEDGVVLQLEGARISLKATESIDLDCKRLNVTAEDDVRIDSGGDMRLRGKIIRLN
jgi:phage gp45-like